MRQSLRVLTVSALAVAFAGLGSTAQAADEATVYVLHGIPGATVDVYANGDELLTDFEPGTLTDPLMLPAGEYDLKVTMPDAGADGKAVVKASVTVPANANVTVVAHLDKAGAPALTPFVNDTSTVAAGEARLTVRHAAAAPAVDVRANGDVVFDGLVNGDEAMADVPAGTVSADVVLAGTDTVAIGPADVTLAEGTNTIVYAWGSAEDSSLDLAVQVIDGLHSAPSGVPAGDGGQASGNDGAALRLGLVAAVALTAGALVMLARRRATAQI